MARAFILLFDSFGIGAADDAAHFGDEGANTFGQIANQCARHLADKPGLREGKLSIPHLTRLGLTLAAEHASQAPLAGLDKPPFAPEGLYGYAAEKSTGKDTPSGHWEIAGVPVLFDWGYFPKTTPCFPKALTDALIQEAALPGILGNRHASGTTIISELGEEHSQTGKPIVYTSGDSVFQIAAHETAFGLERLYDLCVIVRKLVNPYHIGRVIARPFLGEKGHFYRTGNRRDLAVPPPKPTLLDKLVEAHRDVIAIGKVADIFAHRGITQTIKADGNNALFEALLKTTETAPDGSLTFVNFVDFDMLYGHRRDVAGYAAALEALDAALPSFKQSLKSNDIAIITADHGCDPTFPGSDHTREYIPILLFGPKITPCFIGKRDTFADIGQTVASHLGIAPLDVGEAFL